ncbi:DUF4861 domain-containing protein [Saprospiraceae bacterium]|nr:DUF4861 domain-containing protein [Saprospiraceae bacterium]
MRFIQCLVLLLIASFLHVSCKTSPAEVDKAEVTLESVKANETKKTQALLLIQPFQFNPAEPNKIVGDYIAKSKLTVPQDLPIQFKWIMFEGPVLENDLVAYRFFADSRNRIDIFGKKVSDLVMDTVSWEYHNIMDWGSDILMVGNSLGLASPAIFFQDSLYTLSNCKEKTIEIIDNKNKKSTIRTTFIQLDIEGQVFDLVQDWSIEACQPWSELNLKVINGKLPDGMSFATGIVKHLPEVVQGETTDYFYAMNWGKQSFHKENLGMAVLAEKKYQPEPIVDDLNHAYVFKNANNEVRYRFLSVWEKDNNMVKDATGFKQVVEKAGM